MMVIQSWDVLGPVVLVESRIQAGGRRKTANFYGTVGFLIAEKTEKFELSFSPRIKEFYDFLNK